MAEFRGADVDGLDRTAEKMLKASEACTAVAAALTALATALEAMSWTGFAAALAAYLRAVVIPWVKATAAALKAFGQVLQLASSDQKEVSGDRPVVTTGSGGYQSPQLPTASCGDGPRLATIEIRITNGTTGQGSGVQVTTPSLPGAVTPPQVTSGGTGTPVTSGPVVATPGGSSLSTGSGSTGAAGAAPVTPASPVQVGSGGVGSSGAGGASGSGASGGGGASGGWGGNLGISSRPDGGIDVQGSFHGTIGGDPTGTSTPAVGAQGHTSLGSPVSGGSTPDGSGGGLNSALLAAPLGLAGLGAAALGGRALPSGSGDSDGSAGASGSGPTGTGATGSGSTGTGSTGSGSTTAGDESGWRLLATRDAQGHVGFDVVADTDTVPTALDAGLDRAAPPQVLGWLDGDGDYGFVADDLHFTTPAGEVVIDHLTLTGSIADDPAVVTTVRDWWAQALTESGADAAQTSVAAPAATR